jgi:hypothetical protein
VPSLLPALLPPVIPLIDPAKDILWQVRDLVMIAVQSVRSVLKAGDRWLNFLLFAHLARP